MLKNIAGKFKENALRQVEFNPLEVATIEVNLHKDIIARELGLTKEQMDEVEIELRDAPTFLESMNGYDGVAGLTTPEKKVVIFCNIHRSVKLLRKPFRKMILDTFAHEMRHVRQIIDGTLDFDAYVSKEDGYKAYRQQQVEVEANQFAAYYVKKYFV